MARDPQGEPELAPDETVAASDAAHETAPPPVAQDILLRAIGKMARKSVQTSLLNRTRDSDEAKLLLESRSIVRAVATYGVTRVATKSVPGALLVGAGLVAKLLFDRSQARRASRRGKAKE